MRVRLIVNSVGASWILGRFARELERNLRTSGVEVERGDRPSPGVDVNHWLQYIQYSGECANTLNTVLITHIDEPQKFFILLRSARTVNANICLSRQTVAELARRGLPRARLCAILPPPDDQMKPRRITIGLTTRLYDDGRKREDKILEVARTLRLDSFRFDIIGAGWEKVIPQLESAGATVRYYPGSDDDSADLEINRARVASFDYYLYAGEDEGSMGFLDACAAGVPTIVTPQGFHLDVPHGITHPFWSGADLVEVFRAIESKRNSLPAAVAGLTWKRYADRHLEVWTGLLAGKPLVGIEAAWQSDEVAPVAVAVKPRLRAEYDFWLRPALREARRFCKSVTLRQPRSG